MESLREFADDVENILMRRPLKKLPSALPCSPPSRIENPISFAREKLDERLFPRDRGHAIAENNRVLPFDCSSRRQELGDDFPLKAGTEHAVSLADGHSPTELNYKSMNYIYGINAVAEALKARGRTFSWVGVAKERHDLRLKHVVDECRRQGVAVRVLPRAELDELAGNNAHQGVVAVTSAKQYNNLEDVVAAKRGEHSLIVVLDGIEDPHNLGAILRTADAAGADGVVIPERRAAGVTATVTKASAGASEHLPIAKVTNIARTLEDLKAQNLWMVGLDERGTQSYDSLDYNMDCAIVLGAEGKGLHDLVARKCDFLVSIPMLGKVPSLNVSVAAGVMLYEIVRQRRKKSA
jgi:23S rRNA (guanosine2251-2'-O)-methyltransferase